MLDRETRAAILRLREQGHPLRKIAQDVGVSRNAMRAVLASGQVESPLPVRPRGLTDSLGDIRALYVECRGNIVRVQEELQKRHGSLFLPHPFLPSGIHQLFPHPPLRAHPHGPRRRDAA